MPNNNNGNRTATVEPKGGQRTIEDDIAATYNAFKTFEGKRYTGVKIGRGHRWHYQAGEWKERKVTPDKWEINFAVNKRRAGNAPEGSGVPVGTQYHWYILAHQIVRKLDANEYTTAMTGVKYKLAHMRADKGTWSASETAQRRLLIKIFQEMIDQLQAQQEEAKHPAPAQIEPTKPVVAKQVRKARKPRRVPELVEAA